MTPSLRTRIWTTVGVLAGVTVAAWLIAVADPAARPVGLSALAVAIVAGGVFGWVASRTEWTDRWVYFTAGGVGAVGYLTLFAVSYGRWAVAEKATLLEQSGGVPIPEPLLIATTGLDSYITARGAQISADAAPTAGTLLIVVELLVTLLASLAPTYAMVSGLFVSEAPAEAEGEYVAEYRSEDALDTDTDIDVTGLSGLDLAGK